MATVEPGGAVDAVELQQLAFYVAVDDGALDAAEEEFLKNLLGLLGMAGEAHVLAVLCVRLAALDPARTYLGGGQGVAYAFVGADDETLRMRDARAHEDACHALAYAVLDAVSRVDDQVTGIFALLKHGYGAVLSAHVEDDVLAVGGSGAELLFTVYVHFAAALAELVGDVVEDCGVVAYMIRRECTCAHYPRYFDFSHCRNSDWFINTKLANIFLLAKYRNGLRTK